MAVTAVAAATETCTTHMPKRISARRGDQSGVRGVCMCVCKKKRLGE